MRYTYSFNVGVRNLLVREQSFRGHHDPAMFIKDGTSQDHLLSSVGRARSSPLCKHCKDDKDEASRNRLLYISMASGWVAIVHTRTMTTITVEFLEILWEEERSTCFRRYCVPTDASQCIPNTAPARMIAQSALFHQEFVQVARRTKNTESATILATTATTAAPTTFPTL